MKNAIVAGNKAKRKCVYQQIRKYKKAGFPKKYGAFECNVIIRKHNDSQCIQIMEDWYKEFNDAPSKRDQLSFVYCLWKKGYNSSFIGSLGDNVRENPRFLIHKHK